MSLMACSQVPHAWLEGRKNPSMQEQNPASDRPILESLARGQDARNGGPCCVTSRKGRKSMTWYTQEVLWYVLLLSSWQRACQARTRSASIAESYSTTRHSGPSQRSPSGRGSPSPGDPRPAWQTPRSTLPSSEQERNASHCQSCGGRPPRSSP